MAKSVGFEMAAMKKRGRPPSNSKSPITRIGDPKNHKQTLSKVFNYWPYANHTETTKPGPQTIGFAEDTLEENVIPQHPCLAKQTWPNISPHLQTKRNPSDRMLSCHFSPCSQNAEQDTVNAKSHIAKRCLLLAFQLVRKQLKRLKECTEVVFVPMASKSSMCFGRKVSAMIM